MPKCTKNYGTTCSKNSVTEILAVVPARAGSKGLPGKNTRPLQGHPLIAYSIAAGLQSDLVNRVVCSTDSEDIAEISIKYGADVPFLRPYELAQDDSTDIETFKHLIDQLKEIEGYRPDIIVQLRPTSPVRKAGQVDNGIRTLIEHPNADSIRAVTLTSATPYKMWRVENNVMKPLLEINGIPEPFNMPRQALPKIYWQTGTLDIIRTRVIESGSMTGSVIKPFIVDPEHAIDIDHFRSFMDAENVISKNECVKPIIIES